MCYEEDRDERATQKEINNAIKTERHFDEEGISKIVKSAVAELKNQQSDDTINAVMMNRPQSSILSEIIQSIAEIKNTLANPTNNAFRRHPSDRMVRRKESCSNCGIEGHTAEVCRRFDGECTYCGYYGHREKHCRKKQFSSLNRGRSSCTECGSPNHRVIDCPQMERPPYRAAIQDTARGQQQQPAAPMASSQARAQGNA